MLCGNTVRITGEFVTWAGSKADAVDAVLNISDSTGTPIEIIPLDESHHIGVGTYQVDYLVPNNYGTTMFEIVGMIEGGAEVARIQEVRAWM